MPFLIIFVVIPLIEIAVFMTVGEYIGIGTTLFLAFLTAIIGGFIIKYQGLHTLMAAQKSFQKNQLPLHEIFDGFCLIAAGATLITPGFVTDTIGFLLLIPALRTLLRKLIKKHSSFYMAASDFDSRTSSDPSIIEAEYEQINDDEDQTL